LTDLPVAALLVLALAFGTTAGAQVLYKLVDRNGKVTYSDTEPKNFDGKVTRIEPEAEGNVLPSAKTPSRAAPDAPRNDASTNRRKAREELEVRLRAAQAAVEAARKAKSEGDAPLPEEMQTVQRQFAPLQPGEDPPRTNCFPVTTPQGNEVLMCPLRIPQESYFERQRKLEEELRRAEEALALAEREYRRGTD
jgi:hypothetical protein